MPDDDDDDDAMFELHFMSITAQLFFFKKETKQDVRS